MDTKLDFKIGTKQGYDVIGQGPMLKTACQIGQWWVVPAQDYQGKIPIDIQQQMFLFLQENKNVEGFLIADDIKNVEGKNTEVVRPDRNLQAIETGLGILRTVIGAIAMGFVFLFSAIFSYDPMLIAVLSDGRWICLGTWYE